MMPAAKIAARGCFVEASAGTGKIHTLVNEIAGAIEGGVPVDRIAAVTFTHAAAGSMKYAFARNWSVEKTRDWRCGRSTARSSAPSTPSVRTCSVSDQLRPLSTPISANSTTRTRALFDDVFREWLAPRLKEPAPFLRRALARLALERGAVSRRSGRATPRRGVGAYRSSGWGRPFHGNEVDAPVVSRAGVFRN